MQQNGWLSMIAGAVVIAAATSLILAPKLEQESSPAVEPVVIETDGDTGKKAEPSFANAAIISREADGHYWTRAEVDGTAVKFMVDTGASTVALTYRDARRIGLNPEELDYKWEIRTAGGLTYGASVLLEEIRIGRVKVENVEAMILKNELDVSLLGMTFLGELDSYEFRKKQLIIRR